MVPCLKKEIYLYYIYIYDKHIFLLINPCISFSSCLFIFRKMIYQRSLFLCIQMMRLMERYNSVQVSLTRSATSVSGSSAQITEEDRESACMLFVNSPLIAPHAMLPLRVKRVTDECRQRNTAYRSLPKLLHKLCIYIRLHRCKNKPRYERFIHNRNDTLRNLHLSYALFNNNI